MQAVMECDALVDALLGRTGASAGDKPAAGADADLGLDATISSAALPASTHSAAAVDDDLPDWLLSAAMDLGTSVGPAASDEKQRRPAARRTKKTDD